MSVVMKWKGLYVEKIIVYTEEQRILNKNKYLIFAILSHGPHLNYYR